MQDFRFYVVLDTDICTASGNPVEIARKVTLAGVDILQLRAKNCSNRKILELSQAIKKLVRRSKTLFVLNDRVDLARIAGLDGVHLGQGDLPVKYARDILGPDKIVGLSTHSLEQAQEAEQLGADYIGIGPIFATTTKPASCPLGPEIISEIKQVVHIPFVAIGGINLDNLNQVLKQGAQRVAVCQAVLGATDISSATKEFRSRLYGQENH